MSNIEFKSASYAGSITMRATGPLDLLQNNQNIEFIDIFSHNDDWDTRIIRRSRHQRLTRFLPVPMQSLSQVIL
ncbi:hypothetical protein [Plebeiibacterium marinum]|uniref:Uncharacterized protein n=1 Tax=Plebeiibacterium marinum TaxID=2992111 RepID=A0AAE3MFW5_9BACT|nr:hypothetical protein [Plebeiobacterium marinum]MCW3806789.1 hypothetical protein [Plebeiobacterium marinum]